MKQRLQETDHASRPRRGFVLAVVTVTVVLLALAAYNYSGTMLVEYQAASMGGRDLTARAAAESAIEFAATRVMERDADDTINLYNDPDVFRGIILQDSPNARATVRCTVLTLSLIHI